MNKIILLSIFILILLFSNYNRNNYERFFIDDHNKTQESMNDDEWCDNNCKNIQTNDKKLCFLNCVTMSNDVHVNSSNKNQLKSSELVYNSYNLFDNKLKIEKIDEDKNFEIYKVSNTNQIPTVCRELFINQPKKSWMIKNKKRRFAYVSLLFPDINTGEITYQDGCILSALSIRKQGTNADIVCLVTPDIDTQTRNNLKIVFDIVQEVDYITPNENSFKNSIKISQDIFKPCNYLKGGKCSHNYCDVFTKLHLWNKNLLPYEKVLFIDSDLFPLKFYDSLFTLDTPAGWLEYRKKSPLDLSWKWDRCNEVHHGKKISENLTNLVSLKAADINAGLLLVSPNMNEYDSMINLLKQPLANWFGMDKKFKGAWTFGGEGPLFNLGYCYPEQNFLTQYYSGSWKYISWIFASWALDPCNSFGIHTAGMHKLWLKQYMNSWDHMGDSSNQRKIEEGLAQLLFNQIVIWGYQNYPKLLNTNFMDNLSLIINDDENIYLNEIGEETFQSLDEWQQQIILIKNDLPIKTLNSPCEMIHKIKNNNIKNIVDSHFFV